MFKRVSIVCTHVCWYKTYMLAGVSALSAPNWPQIGNLSLYIRIYRGQRVTSFVRMGK